MNECTNAYWVDKYGEPCGRCNGCNARLGLTVSARAFAHAADNGWVPDPDIPHRFKRPSSHPITGAGGVGVSHFLTMFEHDDKCVECGYWIEYGGGWDESSKVQSVCFGCGFYLQHLREWSSLDAIIEGRDGKRWGYYPGSAAGGNPDHRGSGGTRHVIVYDDGRRVETVDLWCWSFGIPDHFHDRFPINAKFDHESERAT